jgi:hypothetical protein
MLFQFGPEDEQDGVLVRERHAVRLPRVALYLDDEPLLVAGAGFEPAVTQQHPVHYSSRRR